MTSSISLSSPSGFKPGIFLFGGVQLSLGIAAALWAGRIWARAEVGLPASFWGAVALAIFLFGLAQINLVGPLRALRGHRPPPKLALPYRLAPRFGEVLTVWPLFSLAFAFGAPVVPMIFFLLRVEGDLAEFNLIWVGLTLTGALLGGATFWLGLKKLFEQFNGSQTFVEASAETVKPGESFSVFVRHLPGKIWAGEIQVKVVCQTEDTRPRKGGKVVEKTVLFEQVIQPPISLTSAGWQGTWHVTLPEGVPLSEPHPNVDTMWGIEVRVQIPNAPDFVEMYGFIVDDPELRARWEKEWAAQDAADEAALADDGG